MHEPTTIEKRADEALARASALLHDVHKVAPPLHRRAIHLTKGGAVFGVRQGAVVDMPDGEPEDMERPSSVDDFSFVMRGDADEVLRIWRADHYAKSSALREALGVSLGKGQTVTVGRALGDTSDGVSVYTEVAVCTTTDPRDAVAKEAQDWDVMSPMRSLAGEAGVHGHTLNRVVGRTNADGEHSHLFMVEREVADPITGEVMLHGMMLFTDRDGSHEHAFEGGDATGSETSGHVHRLTLDAGMRAALAGLLGVGNLEDTIGVELSTEADGEHAHEVQVFATAIDGIHRHVLKLPDGSTVRSLNGDDFSALMMPQAEVAMRAAKAEGGWSEFRLSPAAPVAARKDDPSDTSDAPAMSGAADVDKQGHVHPLPDGGMTGAAEGEDHVHELPGGDTTGPPFAVDGGHAHSLPDGGETGLPREEVDVTAAADAPPAVTQAAPAGGDGVTKSAGRSVRLLKAEEVGVDEERFVFGVVLVPGEVDAQGDTYSAGEVRKAAHGYMQHFGGVLKVMHQGQPVAGARVVETYLTKAAETHGEETFVVGTWLMGTKIDRSDAGDLLWEKVLSGDFTGYSIGGTALRESLAPSDG